MKGLRAEFGVGEDAAEGFGADVAFSDVGVAIDVRGAGGLTVVGVDYVHVGESEDGFGVAQGVAKAGLAWRYRSRRRVRWQVSRQ